VGRCKANGLRGWWAGTIETRRVERRNGPKAKKAAKTIFRFKQAFVFKFSKVLNIFKLNLN
jgi:hypothetical protein